MDIRDITKEQLGTLILLRSLEEFISDKHEEYPTLGEAVWELEQSLSDEDYKQLVTDICRLTEKGYLLSDGTAETVDTVKDMEPVKVVQTIRIPEVEGITLKGQSALDDWEKEIRGSIDKEDKGATDIYLHLSLFGDVTINNSLLSISNTVFSLLANKVKELLHI